MAVEIPLRIPALDKCEEALRRIAGLKPSPPDLTASDLDLIAEELYDDALSMVNIAREALGMEKLQAETCEEDEENDDAVET